MTKKEMIKFVGRFLVDYLNDDHTKMSSEWIFNYQPTNERIMDDFTGSIFFDNRGNLSKQEKIDVHGVLYDLYKEAGLRDDDVLTKNNVRKLIKLCDRVLGYDEIKETLSDNTFEYILH